MRGLCLIVALLILPVASAQLEYYGSEYEIANDLSIKVDVVLKFSEPLNEFSYKPGLEIYDLKTESEFNSSCSVYADEIRCEFQGMTEDNRILKLHFKTKGLVSQFFGNYRFTLLKEIRDEVERMFLQVTLPERAVLSENPANKSYLPNDGFVVTDGKHIMVCWNRRNLKPGDSLHFAVSFAMPGASFNYLYLVVPIFAVLAFVIFYYRIKHREALTSILSPDEKKIVDILLSKGGKALQKVLVKETDFSKAKVSRLIKSLKIRGVVDIEPVSGRENRIRLTFGKKRKEDETGMAEGNS